MSVIKFLACSNMPIEKTKFTYTDILPHIDKTQMCGNGGITFVKELSSAEKATILDIFSGYYVYAIHSDLGLEYQCRYKSIISESFAQNAFDEIVWLKQFIKHLLYNNDMVLLLTLDLGYPTDKFCLKTNYIDIDKWKLDDKRDIIFPYGIVNQFVDNTR